MNIQSRTITILLFVILLIFPTTTFAQTGDQDPSLVWVSYSNYELQVPSNWLNWTYQANLSESENETALIQLVQQIDSTAVQEAQAIIQANIPGFTIVSLSPQLVGDDLMVVTLTPFSLSASLQDLNLNSGATNQQIFQALGLVPNTDTNPVFGYWLEQDETNTTMTLVYTLAQSDLLLLLSGNLSNQAIGDLQLNNQAETITQAINNLDQSNPTFHQLLSILTSLRLVSDQIDPSQCPNAVNLGQFSSVNTSFYYPFTITAQYTVGTVDLTTLGIDPELEPTQGTDLVFPLSGYIQDFNCPDAYFTAQPCSDPLNCSVSIIFTSTGVSNPSLLVLQPDGLYVFADIVKAGGNLDPAVAARPTQDQHTIPNGTYQLWLGGHYPGETINGQLLIIVQ